MLKPEEEKNQQRSDNDRMYCNVTFWNNGHIVVKHQRHYDVFLYKSDLTSKLLACSVYLDQHASETGDNTEAEARQRLFFFSFLWFYDTAAWADKGRATRWKHRSFSRMEKDRERHLRGLTNPLYLYLAEENEKTSDRSHRRREERDTSGNIDEKQKSRGREGSQNKTHRRQKDVRTETKNKQLFH